MLPQHGAQFFRQGGHFVEILRTADVEPVPDLLHAHALLALGNANAAKRFGEPPARIADKRRLSRGDISLQRPFFDETSRQGRLCLGSGMSGGMNSCRSSLDGCPLDSSSPFRGEVASSRRARRRDRYRRSLLAFLGDAVERLGQSLERIGIGRLRAIGRTRPSPRQYRLGAWHRPCGLLPPCS